MKKYKPKIYNFKTKNLNLFLKKEIFALKKSHYRYSLASQKKWFKKNINTDDTHLVLILNKRVIGYNLLHKKKCNIYYEKKTVSASIFIFDTLIIHKHFRKKNFSKIISFTGFNEKNYLNSNSDINFWIDSKKYNLIENVHQFYLLAIVDLIKSKLK